MNRLMPGPLAIAFVLIRVGASGGAMILAGACDEKKSADTASSVEAGTDKYVTADPKLAKALQAAASAAAASENGPPLDGIFPPGVADKRHPKGVTTKVDVIGDGDEPRISLAGPSPDATRAASFGPGAMELQMQMGPRVAMPTVDFGLVLHPAKKEDGGADWLVADVKKASTAKEQLGELPPGTDQAIASLGGTQIRIKLSTDGSESDLQMQLGKDSHAELERLARSAAEALVFATVPTPPKPVGVGAQWIAETRMPLSGLDVIAYRAYRVKGIDGARVHLTLDVKAYAAGTDTDLLGVPKGATLKQIDATAQGEMELVRGEVLARKSDVQQRIVMMFDAPGEAQPPSVPGQAPQPDEPSDKASGPKTLTAQMQSQATFVRGDDLRSALRP
jgi:hypothetical protein